MQLHMKASGEETRQEWKTSEAHWKPCELHRWELEVWSCVQAEKPSVQSHANHSNFD